MTFFKMSIYARSGRLGLPHESLPCISARFWSVPYSRCRHHPAAQLNNLFGHAPHDPKDPIHSVTPLRG